MSLNRIIVYVDGGVVQEVAADRPEEIEVVLVDGDTDGCDLRRTITIGDDRALVLPMDVTATTPQDTRWHEALARREARERILDDARSGSVEANRI